MRARGWPGFHHHGTLCIAAYGFLISERERDSPPQNHIPPLESKKSPVPSGYRPRGRPRSGRSATSPNSIATIRRMFGPLRLQRPCSDASVASAALPRNQRRNL